MLTEIDFIPDGLLQASSTQLHSILKGPTLIHLQGKNKEPLFVSVLLHGNEFSGWEVIKRFLVEQKNLPRSLSIFIANVKAAESGRRHLPEQPDFNRVWNGGNSPEHKMMQHVVKIMREKSVFASIDIHNNTGINPYYACINNTDNRYINLARDFSDIIVYFLNPASVQCMAFSRLCPAVTLECGKPGDEKAIELAKAYLTRCINLENVSDAPPDQDSITIYHTIAVVKVNNGISVGFDNDSADVIFSKDLELFNYKEVPAGSTIASEVNTITMPLSVYDEESRDVTDDYFLLKDGTITNSKEIIPAMFTSDKSIITDDCLCYFMEHYYPTK